MIPTGKFRPTQGLGGTVPRARLGGRIRHRVHDPGTVKPALGDLGKDAVAVGRFLTRRTMRSRHRDLHALRVHPRELVQNSFSFWRHTR